MNFADQATADLVVMLNDGEFASLLAINGGAPVACVLDEDLSKVPVDGEGVHRWEASLYVRAADLDTPQPFQRLTVDGRKAVVVSANVVHGLLTVRLRWFES